MRPYGREGSGGWGTGVERARSGDGTRVRGSFTVSVRADIDAMRRRLKKIARRIGRARIEEET